MQPCSEAATSASPCAPPRGCRELHEQCRSSLEAGYLHGLMLHALGAGREAAPAAAAGADGGVCLAALRLLAAVLGWSFSKGGRGGWGTVGRGCCAADCVAGRMRPRLTISCSKFPAPAAGGSGVWRVLESGRPAAEASHLRPPASWRDALLAPDAWAFLAQLSQVQGCAACTGHCIALFAVCPAHSGAARSKGPAVRHQLPQCCPPMNCCAGSRRWRRRCSELSRSCAGSAATCLGRQGRRGQRERSWAWRCRWAGPLLLAAADQQADAAPCTSPEPKSPPNK